MSGPAQETLKPIAIAQSSRERFEAYEVIAAMRPSALTATASLSPEPDRCSPADCRC